MFHLYLKFIRDFVEEYIKNDVGMAVPVSFVDIVGPNFKSVDKNIIGISVNKIKNECISISGSEYVYNNPTSFIERKKPASFSLYIYFISFFSGDRFLEGLQYLSSIVKCFLTYSFFSPQNSNAMSKLGIEDFNISQNDDVEMYKNNINYPPALLYKLWLIHIHPEESNKTIAAITKI